MTSLHHRLTLNPLSLLLLLLLLLKQLLLDGLTPPDHDHHPPHLCSSLASTRTHLLVERHIKGVPLLLGPVLNLVQVVL
jgi:hypothetical protein